MAICVFIGHDQIYDIDLFDRTMAAVESVVQQEDDIEFTFSVYEQNKAFEQVGLLVALKVKQRYPKKNITLTIIKRYEERERFVERLQKNCAELPSSFVDQVRSAPLITAPESKMDDVTFVNRRIRHYEAQHADYLIGYLYPNLDVPARQFYKTARINGAIIQDVINPDTATYIVDATKYLPIRQQFIHEEYIAGKSRKEIAASLDLGTSRIQQSLHKSSRAIQAILRDRMHQQRRAAGLARTHICCLPLVDTVTDYAMEAFHNAIKYLMKNNMVTEFVILQEYPLDHTCELQKDIRQLTDFSRPVETRIMAATDTRQQVLEEVKALIEQSDFCICDLSATPYAKEIMQFAGAAKRAIVIDIGFTCSEEAEH